MRFARRTQTYQKVYRKPEAIKFLLQDERVERIESLAPYRDGIAIYTNPIIPTGSKLILGPIGRYKIQIYKTGAKCLDLNIDRHNNGVKNPNEGGCHRLAPHINQSWGSTICWGNAFGEQEIIRKSGDWFWFAKRALDLLSDGRPEGNGWKRVILLLQYKSAIEENNPRLKKKIMRLLHSRFKLEATINRAVGI